MPRISLKISIRVGNDIRRTPGEGEARTKLTRSAAKGKSGVRLISGFKGPKFTFGPSGGTPVNHDINGYSYLPDWRRDGRKV